jgi:hypothetical protein
MPKRRETDPGKYQHLSGGYGTSLRLAKPGRRAVKQCSAANASRKGSSGVGLEHGRIHTLHTSACNVDVESLKIGQLVELEFGVAVRCVSTVVLETIQILVPLAAHLASVRLLLLHANCAGVGNGGQWVDYRESTVLVLLELLILVAVLF